MGFLDKFHRGTPSWPIGALWIGTLTRRSTRFPAALEFRDAIRAFNEEREVDGQPPIGMGVGVNTGRLVAGYMGAKRRLEYTVIGDTVKHRLSSVRSGRAGSGADFREHS